MSNTIEIQIKHAAKQPGDKVSRVLGTVSPREIANMLDAGVQLTPNPRVPTKNTVVRAILKTLDEQPSLFKYMTKGLLLSGRLTPTGSADSFVYDFSGEYGGILDGGHNFFAIALHFLYRYQYDRVNPNSKIGRNIRNHIDKKIKLWEDLVKAWHEFYPNMKDAIANERFFKFEVPVEFLIPGDHQGKEFWGIIHDISVARNNNVQLKQEAIAQHKGSYRLLELNLPDSIKDKIVWKSGDNAKIDIETDFGSSIRSGKIPLSKIVPLSMVPLLILEKAGFVKKLEDRVNADLQQEDDRIEFKKVSLNSMYVGKAASISTYGQIMDQVSNLDADDPLRKTFIDSMEVIGELPQLWDAIELSFENAFNEAQETNGADLRYENLDCNLDTKTGKSKFVTKDTPTNYLSTYIPKGRCHTFDGFVMPLFDSIACALLRFDPKVQKVVWNCDITAETADIRKCTSQFFDAAMSAYLAFMEQGKYQPRGVGMQQYDMLVKWISDIAKTKGVLFLSRG